MQDFREQLQQASSAGASGRFTEMRSRCEALLSATDEVDRLLDITGGSPRLTDAFLVLFCLKFVQNGLFLQYPFRVRRPWSASYVEYCRSHDSTY